MTKPHSALHRTSAAVTSLAVVVGLLTAAPWSAADAATSTDRLAPAPAARVVSLGGGAEVALTPLGGTGATSLAPLPGADGMTPGLVVATSKTGTTVQTTDAASTPTVIEGHAALLDAGAADAVPLHFSAVGRDGRAAQAYITVFDLEHGAAWTRQMATDPAPGNECSEATFARTTCVLVPPGEYSVMAFVTTLPAEKPTIGSSRTFQNISLVGEPETTVSGERTFAFDARDARQLTITTPGRSTKVPPQGAMLIGYDRTAADGSAVHLDMRPAYLLDQHFYLQPTPQVSIGTFQARTRVRLEAPDIALSAPTAPTLHPEYVDPTWFSDVSSDFPVVDGRSRLPVVEVGHATAADLAGRQLHGALALVTHSADMSIAEQSNNAAAHGAGVVVIRNDGPGDISDPGGTGVKLQVPTIRLNRAEGLALAHLPEGAMVTVEGEPASPYVYDLYLKENDRIPEDPSYVALPGQLATQVRQVYGQPTLPSTFSEAAYPWQPGNSFVVSTVFPMKNGPRTRTEYRIPDPDTAWNFAVFAPESPYNAMFPKTPVLPMNLTMPGRQAYSEREQDQLPFGRAPIIAAPNPARPVQRSGDQLRVAVDGFTDADGNHGTEYTHPSGVRTHLEIRADGALIGETDNLPSGTVRLPTGESRVSISFTADNPQAWNELSTHTDTAWSFPSTTTAGGAAEAQPLLLPDYDVGVDLHNRIRADLQGRVAFDLRLRRADGVPPTPVGDPTIAASYDDGATWRPADVTRGTDGWRVELPAGSGLVSLRLHAADTGGSAVDQTIVRAFDIVR
ncbi:PA domain-containing protein [Micromonospora sp. NPDC048930]|uniref:PA domain-containing protein n=1 Tax=Micromonospora sp. NPDC048930 TaxID=3364261 RepID=UPI00370F8B74